MEKKIIYPFRPGGFEELEKAYRDMEENEGLQLKRIGKDIKRIFRELYNDTFQANDLESLNTQKLRCMQLRRRMKTIVRDRNGSHLGFRLVKPEAQKLIDGYLEELEESEALIDQKLKKLEIEPAPQIPDISFLEEQYPKQVQLLRERGVLSLDSIKKYNLVKLLNLLFEPPKSSLDRVLNPNSDIDFSVNSYANAKRSYQIAMLGELGILDHFLSKHLGKSKESSLYRDLNKLVMQHYDVTDKTETVRKHYTNFRQKKANDKRYRGFDFIDVVKEDLESLN